MLDSLLSDCVQRLQRGTNLAQLYLGTTTIAQHLAYADQMRRYQHFSNDFAAIINPAPNTLRARVASGSVLQAIRI
uniref:Uncharacterized protein n=1 Tax=Hyaloperonospora arabidopsidis (strain Emoy2) TaxID=559515 RepID=M4BT78_HYAAE